MASTFSFDIESTFDKGELINAVDQAQRDIGNRYDLKGTSAGLAWADNDRKELKVTGDNEFHIDAVLDILRKKLAARGQSQKVLDTAAEPAVSNMLMTKKVGLKSGLDQDKAKKITGLIRDTYPKVKTQIQGDVVRVTGPKKDELQAVMQLLERQDFDFPIVFTNYR